MGYIDDEVKRLQSVIDKLEHRVKGLETRQFGGSLSTEAIRMILIGPPGAGKSWFPAVVVPGAPLGPRAHAPVSFVG